jgi:hypothetical protein
LARSPLFQRGRESAVANGEDGTAPCALSGRGVSGGDPRQQHRSEVPRTSTTIYRICRPHQKNRVAFVFETYIIKSQNKFEINRSGDFSEAPDRVISNANGCHSGGSLPGMIHALVCFDS